MSSSAPRKTIRCVTCCISPVIFQRARHLCLYTPKIILLVTDIPSCFLLPWYSAFPSSVSTVNRFAQRTPRVRNSICSSVPVSVAIPVRLSRSPSLPNPPPTVSALQMVIPQRQMDLPPPPQVLALAPGLRCPPLTVP